MKTPPEQAILKAKPAPASESRRRPMLPTVFIRTSVLEEQMKGKTAAEFAAASFPALSNDIRKKTGELRERLHEMRYSPSRVPPYTFQEAEIVLRQAELILWIIPEGPAAEPAGLSKERLCNLVDIHLMLDAALRALHAP